MEYAKKKSLITDYIKDKKKKLTIGDMYKIYNDYKVAALFRILGEECEVTFCDEEGITDTKERNFKVSM